MIGLKCTALGHCPLGSRRRRCGGWSHSRCCATPSSVSVFRDFGSRYIERLGTDIRRMALAMEGHGLFRPRFEEVGSEFRVTLIGPGKRFMEEVTARPAWAEGLNERQVEAVLYVGEHGRITNREYRDLTGVSRRWATKELQEMVDLGILAVRGTGRAIHYVLVRNSARLATAWPRGKEKKISENSCNSWQKGIGI